MGSVAKMKASTKRSKKVAALLYSSFRGNVATCYGLTMEAETIQQYTANQKANGHPDLTVNKCGLFVSLNNHWLAATPDGSVHDPTDPDIQGILVHGIKLWLKPLLLQDFAWRKEMINIS